MSERDGLIECYKTCGYYCDRSVVLNTSGRTGIVAGGGSCPYVHLVSARKEIEELKKKVLEDHIIMITEDGYEYVYDLTCEDCPCTQEFWKCKVAQTDRDSITGHTWTQPSKDCPYVHLASARKEIEELKAKVEELEDPDFYHALKYLKKVLSESYPQNTIVCADDDKLPGNPGAHLMHHAWEVVAEVERIIAERKGGA